MSAQCLDERWAKSILAVTSKYPANRLWEGRELLRHDVDMAEFQLSGYAALQCGDTHGLLFVLNGKKPSEQNCFQLHGSKTSRCRAGSDVS